MLHKYKARKHLCSNLAILLSLFSFISCSSEDTQPSSNQINQEVKDNTPQPQKVEKQTSEDRKPVTVGYFHGGRCHTLYRALIFGWLEDEGVDMDLYASYLEDQMNFQKVSEDHQTLANIRDKEDFGRTRGTSIVQAMMNGEVEGGTIGESSFIDAVQKGYPIVAVAELGHDFKDLPGKVILTRKGFKPESAEDLRGKILTTRRAGPGDSVFLKEYLYQNGLVPGKDVTVIDQVSDHYQKLWLEKGLIDGGLYHLWGVRKLLDANKANIFRRMDWFNPEISQAVLVFRQDVIENRPEDIQKIVDGYTKRLIFEEAMSIPEKTHPTPTSQYLGLVIYLEYEGMRMPAATYPPLLEANLLNEMQDMLVRHGEYKAPVKLEGNINNRFVEDFMKRYEAGEVTIPNKTDPQLIIQKSKGKRVKDFIIYNETPQSLLKKRQAEQKQKNQ